MSKENKWTKETWEWVEDHFRGGYSALMSGDDYVLYPQRENDGDDGAAWFGTDEHYYGETALTEANANLIAAAPELYEALIRVQQEGGMGIGLHRQIDRVLAKARGEQ